MTESTPTATGATSPSASLANATEPLARGDKHIWGIYIALCLISVIELYSASSREVAASTIGVFGPLVRHVMMLLCGLGLVLGLQRTHYRHFYRWSVVFVIISIFLMAWCMVGGEVINGARRSVNLVVMKVQPSEFIKMSAVLVTALVAQRCMMKGGGITNTGVTIMACAVLIFSAMLIKQGLTNTLLLMGISCSMFLIGGIQWKKFFIVLMIYGVGAIAFATLGDSHEGEEADPVQTEQTTNGTAALDESENTAEGRHGTWYKRLERFRGDGRPKYEHEINATNRQEMYAYMAQANGGIFGVGPGNSRETARLPLAFSDYIFSIIVEDTGLMGGLFVLILYLWLLARAATIAARCTRAFPALLVLGMAVMIAMQALFHIGIVTGFFPVSGQPLPLISKGGTSILVTSIAFGVMLSVSRHTARTGKTTDIRQELASLPENLRTENPTKL